MNANQKTAMIKAVSDGLAPGDGQDEPGEEEWSAPAARLADLVSPEAVDRMLADADPPDPASRRRRCLWLGVRSPWLLGGKSSLGMRCCVGERAFVLAGACCNARAGYSECWLESVFLISGCVPGNESDILRLTFRVPVLVSPVGAETR